MSCISGIIISLSAGSFSVLDILSSLIQATLVAMLVTISIYFLLLVANMESESERLGCPEEDLPMISVMSYAWQSGNIIERKIENFLDLDYPEDKIEIIIYDNQSTDETREICKRYEKRGLIKYYRPREIYDRKAPTLDEAIGKIAKGEIILLTDPDGICERDWARKMVEPFLKDHKVGAVIGLTHCGNWHKNLFTRVRAVEDEWNYNVVPLGIDGKVKLSDFLFICGANYGIRREAWRDVKGHGRSLIEDFELTLKLYERGWKVDVARAHVWQEEVESVDQYLRQRIRWYSFNIREILSGRNKIQRILGSIPFLVQVTSVILLSSIISSLILLYAIPSLVFLSGWLLFSMIAWLIVLEAVCWGMWRLRKKRLIPYVPLFLTFDALLHVLCMIYTRFKKVRGEVTWVPLVKGKYYHVGTPITRDC